MQKKVARLRALENKIPPVLLVIICGAVTYLVSQAFPRIGVSQSVGMWLGLLFTAAGLLIASAGALEFRRRKTTIDPMHPGKASALVDSGVYKFSRNPMYVGVAAFLVAFAFFMQSLFLLLSVPLFIVVMNKLQIEPEEVALLSIFGEEYEQYKSRVRRWL